MKLMGAEAGVRKQGRMHVASNACPKNIVQQMRTPVPVYT